MIMENDVSSEKSSDSEYWSTSDNNSDNNEYSVRTKADKVLEILDEEEKLIDLNVKKKNKSKKKKKSKKKNSVEPIEESSSVLSQNFRKRRSKSSERKDSLSKRSVSSARSESSHRKRSHSQTNRCKHSRTTSRSPSKSIRRSRSHRRSYSKEQNRSKNISARKSKRSGSRSVSRQSRSQSRRRSKSQSRRRSRSNSRRRSRSQSRRRSRSRSRRISRSRSRRISRSRSRRRYRSQSRSRRKSRSQSKRKSRSRSRRKSGSRSRRKSKSRSRSVSKHERISISHDRSRSRSKETISSKPLFKRTALDFANKKGIEIKLQTNAIPEIKKITTISNNNPKHSLYGKWEKYEQPVKNSDINKFTNLCREISAKEEFFEEREKEENIKEVHHPFKVEPAPVMLPPMLRNRPPTNPAQAIMAGSLNSITAAEPVKTGPLENYFPVSSGTEHQKFENHGKETDGIKVYEKFETNAAPINVSAVIARRLGAQQILNSRPEDPAAQMVLADCDMKLKKWSYQNKNPGKFTGSQLGTKMNKYEISGAVETRVRKDFFHNLAPLTGGIGMRMMQKMGWQMGKALGKNQEGYVTPIAVDVKVGRVGLHSADEQPQYTTWNGRQVPKRRPPQQIVNVNGKHPVSLLAEICVKKGIGAPGYECVFEHGKSHSKNFLMKVTIANVDYQSSVASPTKKHAKANAAMTALRIMGEVKD